MPGLPDPGPIVAVARRYPVPFAVGAVGFVVVARLVSRRAAPAVKPDPDEKQPTRPAARPAAAPLSAAPPRVFTTPEGCPLPKPPASAGAGPGDFVCDPVTRTWVWQPDAPQQSPDGCPLPKPSIPPTHTGQGDWVCDAGTKRWTWRWSDAPLVPPIPAAGVLTLQPGTYQTWALVGGVPALPQWVTLTAAETWRTGQRVNRTVPGSQLPGGGLLPGHAGLFVPVTSAPGRVAMQGRIFETNQTGAAWRAA